MKIFIIKIPDPTNYQKSCICYIAAVFGYASIPIIPTFFAWWYILADNFLW